MRSKVVGKFFKRLTPEKKEELRQKRINDIKQLSLEYQLGTYIGEYIVHMYLPTLSIDMCTSRKVISVTSDELREYNRLENEWFKKVSDNRHLPDSSTSAPEEWNLLMNFRREMQNKYLPKKLECFIQPLNVQNLEEIKKGIMRSLWNCDMSHYKCETTDDIEIIFDEDGYFTNIILSLDE